MLKTTPIKTVLIIVLGLLILFINFQFNWLLYTALFIAFCGVISQKAARVIDLLWMKLAWLLSLIVPKIILTSIFYLILFPIATIAKFMGVKNGIVLKNNKSSSYVDVHKVFNKTSFEKPW